MWVDSIYMTDTYKDTRLIQSSHYFVAFSVQWWDLWLSAKQSGERLKLFIFYVFHCWLWIRDMSIQCFCNLSVIPVCRLCPSGRRGLPGDVQSRWRHCEGGPLRFTLLQSEKPQQVKWDSVSLMCHKSDIIGAIKNKQRIVKIPIGWCLSIVFGNNMVKKCWDGINKSSVFLLANKHNLLHLWL